ncbi:MAG: ParB/RepB/Spo0J family partition protein [Hyphomonadaceae bacterium]
MNQPVSKNARLGRGLSALLGDYSGARQAIDGSNDAAGEAGEGLAPATLPIDKIAANPRQPRRTFNEAELQELSESIRTKGVLQAILVRPDPSREGYYEIVAGERRWRAARRAGLKDIPAVVREMDDRELLEIAIIENVQRSDLNPIEEGEAYKALMDRFGRTQESVATQVGKSREHVANTLRLLNLPDDVREKVREGQLSAGHARALLRAEDPSATALEVIARKLTVRDTEALAKGEKPSSGAAGKPAAPEEKDVDTKALELDLQRALGLDVDIRHVNGKGGEVRIKYAQLEQLDEVCRLLTRPRIVRPEAAARRIEEAGLASPEPELEPEADAMGEGAAEATTPETTAETTAEMTADTSVETTVDAAFEEQAEMPADGASPVAATEDEISSSVSEAAHTEELAASGMSQPSATGSVTPFSSHSAAGSVAGSITGGTTSGGYFN